MNKWYLSVALFVGTLVGVASCTEQDGPTPNNQTFDRALMLENFAQNLIIPAYSNLQQEVKALEASANAFVENPNEALLADLQNAWTDAYTAWQFANAYNFGPAGPQGLQKSLLEEIGTFPVSQIKIESAIAGTPNFNDFNRDARGFLAIEYLIFYTGDPASSNNSAKTVGDFTSVQRGQFLLGAIADISNRLDRVLDAWNSGYATEFIENAGTDAGSSTSILYNEFVKSFESIKNFKVGLPLGKRPGQTQAEPQLVEAYYSGKSLQMIAAHLSAIDNIWHGRHSNGQVGPGFRAYLENVEGGQALVSSALEQMDKVKASLAGIPTDVSLATQISNEPAAADELHTELQKHTRFYKSDMSSLLGIAITFSSGDGD